MDKDFRQLTLRERLNLFAPFLCIALSHCRNELQSKEECRRRLWCRQAKYRRRLAAIKGVELPKRKQWRRLTFAEIAARGSHLGLKPRTVKWLATRLNWNGIKVRYMLALTEACGVSLTHVHTFHDRFLKQRQRNGAFPHLNTSQRKTFVRLLKKWKESQEISEKNC